MTEISYDEFERLFYGAGESPDLHGLGSEEPRGDVRGALRLAGFSEALTEKGARWWDVGAHFGFLDLVETLRAGDRGVPVPGVTDASVREAARLFTGAAQVMEARSATQMKSRVLERASGQPLSEGRLRVCLIDAGQGSSGYYSPEVLKEAAGLFQAGTHCYLDHPGAAESLDRPERTVNDLAGVLATDAVFRDGGLFADVRVFSGFREQIEEKSAHIGMSIRAEAEVETAEHPGGFGPVVRRITRVESVDFVTRAGRGGRIVGAA